MRITGVRIRLWHGRSESNACGMPPHDPTTIPQISLNCPPGDWLPDDTQMASRPPHCGPSDGPMDASFGPRQPLDDLLPDSAQFIIKRGPPFHTASRQLPAPPNSFPDRSADRQTATIWRPDGYPDERQKRSRDCSQASRWHPNHSRMVPNNAHV